ncbi:MAG: hypothetical protein ABIM96_01920 [Candidatus Saccharimonas sp.]
MSEVPTGGHTTDKRVDPPFSGPLASFEAWLYDMLYTKVPFKFPKAAKDMIVQFGPWITLVVALFSLPVIFAVFAASTVVSYYGVLAGVSYGPMYYVSILVLAVQVVLMFVSVAPLLKRQRKGWQLVFYASTISVIYSLFSSFSYGFFAIAGLLWGLIGAAISYYVIFQIRSYYK